VTSVLEFPPHAAAARRISEDEARTMEMRM
jgi:hypothetical protein